MNKSDRIEAFTSAWRQFQRANASLDAIFDKYRTGSNCAGEAPRGDEAMTPADRDDVGWLRAEIALLAPVLASLPMPKGVPLAQLTEKEIIQAYRLAGWPQSRIDRKLAGEQLARLDRRLGLLLARQGVDRRTATTRNQIATLDIPETDREELMQVLGEWERVGALVDRLSTQVDPPNRLAAAGAGVMADWFQRVGKAEAYCDFHSACQELETFLAQNPMTPDELKCEFVSAVEQRVARMSLDIVPVDRALRDIGFAPQSDNGPDLRWEGSAWDRTMVFGAGPGRVGYWSLSGWYKVAGEWFNQDAEVEATGHRGRPVEALLTMWRQAFGPSVRPPGALDIGRLYEQHREKLGRLDMELPRIELDGPAFRALRQRLRRRFGHHTDAVATLAVVDGALRVSIADAVFNVPARGGLGVDCQVGVCDLIGIPPSCLRGRVIRMERGWSTLTVDWYSIGIRNSAPEEVQSSPGAPATKAGLGQSPVVYDALLTGTFAATNGVGAEAASGAVEREPVNPSEDEVDTGPDLCECFFTKDHSDAVFVLLGYLRCPLSPPALARLANAGRSPNAEGPIAATPFAGKFWWVRGSVARIYPGAGPGTADDVQTTEDLFAAIACGHPVIVMDGPFDTKDDGHYALDAAWESPDA